MGVGSGCDHFRVLAINVLNVRMSDITCKEYVAKAIEYPLCTIVYTDIREGG